ncbi:MAG: hypothetical protein HYX52_09465 [Chloroflexi bacterium]|nr:hypothetical protein [Chloroflexota bacterium]
MLWNIGMPLALLVVYVVVFSAVLVPSISPDVLEPGTFPLYLSVGFLPWTAFADTLLRGTQALVGNAAYLRRLPLPERVFLGQSAVASTIGMLVVLVLLWLLSLVWGRFPTLAWLAMPVVAFLWQAFAYGLTLALGALNVFFRDLTQLVTILVQIWMWSVPVVYVEQLLPDTLRSVLPFNPVYPFLTSLRMVYLQGTFPPVELWLAMAAWVALAVLVGELVLHLVQPEIRDAL